MYLAHWQLTEKPFENATDPRFLYRSEKHEEALNRLLYAVREGKGAAMLCGVYGCGKTLIAEALKEELSNTGRYRTVHLTNPLMDNLDLLREIAFQLANAQGDGRSKTDLLHVIREALEINANDGKSTAVIVDEAQVMETKSTMEELRMLLNIQRGGHFLLTLLLIGQPELKEKINQNKQFQQRIAVSYTLGPLTSQESADYIQHRLKTAGRTTPIFTMEAFRAIIQYSGGIPRRINHVCDLALMAGYSAGVTVIDQPVIQDVMKDIET